MTNMIVIIDGYGNSDDIHSPINIANMKNYNKILMNNPHTTINASGEYVGLERYQQGNSETGHLNIGTGRVVKQQQLLIGEQISSGKYGRKLSSAIKGAKNVHMVAMITNVGTHSHISHLLSSIDATYAKVEGKIFLHLITDGRDDRPYESISILRIIMSHIKDKKNVIISSIGGRYYAMDRDNYIDRTAIAYQHMFDSDKVKRMSNADIIKYIENSHKKYTDEYIPYITTYNARVTKADVVFFVNFRADRMRQIVSMAIDNMPSQLRLLSMTEYSRNYDNVKSLYPNVPIKDNLTAYLTKECGMRVHKVAETTKYAHVTYFFNGGVEQQYDGETRRLINGRKFSGNNLDARMRTKEITDECIYAIISNHYNLIVVNYAATDMIGHTANMRKCVKALRIIDRQIGRLYKVMMRHNVKAIITADHGNIEKIVDENGAPYTAHTSNSVNMITVGNDNRLKSGGSLCDISPTMLDMMNLKKPSGMTGESIIDKSEVL